MKFLPIIAFTLIALASFSPYSVTAAPLDATPINNTPPPMRGLELSIGTQHLTDGNTDWQDKSLRGIYQADKHLFHTELSSKREFDQPGTYIGLSDTYTINSDWYTDLSIGKGTGAFYLPRLRTTAFLNKKWLSDKNLVSSIGLDYYNAPDGHIDRSMMLNALYYFNQPWVVQTGIRFNRSSPGTVHTHQQFIAVTYGRDKDYQLTGRYNWGGEGYLATGVDSSLVNFQSNETSLSWRNWINSRTGFFIDIDHYHNPAYQRSGGNIGIFHQFD